MTLNVHEIIRSLDGAWGIASRDRQALAKFNFSAQGFWNSFAAAALAAPFWLWFVLSQQQFLSDLAAAASRRFAQPPFDSFLLAEGAAYILGWILFPLMMLLVTRLLRVESRFASYIIVHNWAMVLVYFLLAMPPVVLYNLGLIGLETKSLMDLLAVFLELLYMGVIAKRVLEISTASAFGIVILDVLLSTLISGAAQSFYAS